MRLRDRIWRRITRWLNHERPPSDSPPCDFERLRHEIRPGDVLLVEGRSRVAEVIKSITLSNWTHAALYIGRLHDIDDPDTRARVRAQGPADAEEQLLLESLLGRGTVITPLSRYAHDHLRICRPTYIARADAQAVLDYCIRWLGEAYDTRQLLDLARFLFPYNILPRRWRSSLFTHNAGAPTRTVCSTLLARAFTEVHYPVLPVFRRDLQGHIHLQRRNFKLFTPSDFDYSPWFDVIKYPLMDFDELAAYHRLPWDEDGVLANGPGDELVLVTEPDARKAATDQEPGPADGELPDEEIAEGKGHGQRGFGC